MTADRIVHMMEGSATAHLDLVVTAAAQRGISRFQGQLGPNRTHGEVDLMRVHLIAPAGGMKLHFLGKDAFPPLGLLYLAAHTPRDVELRLINENLERIDLAEPPDLVGITTTTATAIRAYEIADRYRERGVKVVLGGIHASMVPEEAAAHADSVVVGEAEALWPGVIADADAGRLEPAYRAEGFPDFQRPRHPRRDIGDPKRYLVPNMVQTSRGCPHNCTFCTVSLFNGRRPRMREVDSVLAELEPLPRSKAIGRQVIFFIDDNIGAKPSRAKELFRALIPMDIFWGSQACMTFANDEELVALAAESGCRLLFIGVESLSPQGLAEIDKHHNKVEQYENAMQMFSKYGILVMGGFVLGLDSDDTSVFGDTLDFAVRNKLVLALFNVLTPYPGTRLYSRLLEEGRVDPGFWFDPFWRSRAVYDPVKMSRETLCEGTYQLRRGFYSYRSILSRLDRKRDWPQQFLANLVYRRHHRADHPRI